MPAFSGVKGLTAKFQSNCQLNNLKQSDRQPVPGATPDFIILHIVALHASFNESLTFYLWFCHIRVTAEIRTKACFPDSRQNSTKSVDKRFTSNHTSSMSLSTPTRFHSIDALLGLDGVGENRRLQHQHQRQQHQQQHPHSHLHQHGAGAMRKQDVQTVVHIPPTSTKLGQSQTGKTSDDNGGGGKNVSFFLSFFLYLFLLFKKSVQVYFVKHKASTFVYMTLILFCNPYLFSEDHKINRTESV